MGAPSGTAVERLGCVRHTSQWAPLTSVYGMRCQYSRWGQVSSEKHATAVEAGAEEGWPRRRGDRRGGGGWRARLESLTVITRRVHATHV
jgi:hypothetical protein